MTANYKRIAEADAVIRAIGSHGRRFFYSKEHDRFATFAIDAGGGLRLIDDWSGKSIRLTEHGKWRGFSHGGTCRAMVWALAVYIRTGKPIHRGHFGPWPEWRCDGDVWGYGADEMERVRAAAFASGAVAAEVRKAA
jgi:hypothetical protein